MGRGRANDREEIASTIARWRREKPLQPPLVGLVVERDAAALSFYLARVGERNFWEYYLPQKRDQEFYQAMQHGRLYLRRQERAVSKMLTNFWLHALAEGVIILPDGYGPRDIEFIVERWRKRNIPENDTPPGGNSTFLTVRNRQRAITTKERLRYFSLGHTIFEVLAGSSYPPDAPHHQPGLLAQMQRMADIVLD